YWASPTISQRTLSGNYAGNGNGGGIFCYYNSSPAIFNCTISGNSADYGGGIYCYYSTPFLVNTIVEGNAGNGGVYFYSSSDASLTYNNFDNNEGGNFTGSPPAHLGQNVTVNANGDSCDIYYNIFEEPLFADPNAGNFNLLADSPCIDAGNPAFPCDPDSTIADVGAFYFDQGAGIPAVEDLAVSIVGDSVILQWTEMTDAQYYKIYRSEVPLFDISSMTAIGLVFEAVYEEENVINGGPWFYVVTVEY
ncbi:MAG: right-handed parallel beta-helix repeat-containing protein, partial [FCB group bacterium]|nr:right-handed parallel beta-helix repeat-containing protein [FCB group bacterium]